jgi:iron(III) transport system substrate-binding protein
MPRNRKVSRRQVLKGSGAALALNVFAQPLRAAAPPSSPLDDKLIAAARKEGAVNFYTAMDLPIAEEFAKNFMKTFSGMTVNVERVGSERLFQRIGQEYSSNIRNVDVANTADASHVLTWHRNGWLEPYLPEEVARHYPAEYRDADGLHVTTRIYCCSLGYNTEMIKAADAPKSLVDLLDPKWLGKLVKAHPSYSGTIMTSTYAVVHMPGLGWEYLEKLAKQKVMQVQSSTDPPKKLALGERPVMADGNDYNLIQEKERGRPVEVIYPTEGAPVIKGPSALFKGAPHPNAARLFQNWLHSREGQQILVDFARQFSAHDQTKEKPGRIPLASIKVIQVDPAEIEKNAEEIKARYTKIFGV